MKFFVSVSSVSTSRLADITNSPNIRHFTDEAFNKGDIIPDELMKPFEKADVVIINGTWGNHLRKDLYLKKNSESGELILNDINYRNIDGSIPYKIRSAIVDEINTQIVNLANELEKPVIVFESATISRAERNYNSLYNLKAKFRIGLGSWIYQQAEWLKPSDFKEVQKIDAPRLYNHKWSMNQEGSIYILTGLETDPTSTMPIYDFISKSIETIRKHTDRRIVVKIHPGSPFLENYLEFENIFQNVFFMKENTRINALYDDMYCAVIDNSTSIFELIDAGIPTYCSEVNFGKGLNNTDLNTINDVYLSSKEEVKEWTDLMCCTEIPISLLKNDRHIKRLIHTLVERKSDGF